MASDRPPKRRRRRQGRKHVVLLNRARPHYDRMLADQGGVCGICGRLPNEKRRFDIDHHHGRMEVRGLLCPRCNRAIWDWMTPEWLRAAADYLDRGPVPWLGELLAEP